MSKSGSRSVLAPVVGAALALASGCSSSSPAGTGGAAASSASSTSSSNSSSSSSSSGGTGGMGSSSTTSSGASTASTSSGSGGGTGGTGGGAGGSGGIGGSSAGGGGSGGGFIPPPGTADYPPETEQNNLRSTANAMQAGTHGFTGSIWPIGDVDVYSVIIPNDGATLTVSTSDGAGNCPPGAATLLRIFDANSKLLGTATDGGSGKCSLLTPLLDPALVSLPKGTYYAQVESADGNAVPAYVVDIEVAAPTCGNGVTEYPSGEQCDDGNTIAGDGCAPTCKLEGSFGAEQEPNNTGATANPMGAFDGMIGAIQPMGDIDWFTFAVTVPGSSVRITVDDGLAGCPLGFDAKVYLYNGAGTKQLASDDDDGPGKCSVIDPAAAPSATNLAVGTYRVKVEYFAGGGTTPFYVMKAKVSPPGCGDGVIQAGEQCDDANATSGDGCSASCQFEANIAVETEPNDSVGTANLLGQSDGFVAAINPIADSDWFSFQVTTPGTVANLAVGDGFGRCPTGADPIMVLFDANVNTLVSDDDGGPYLCSRITPGNYPAVANLAVGTYYVNIQQKNNDTAIPNYVLTVKLHDPGCGDGVREPGEQCDDGGTVAGDGCDASCQVESPWEIEPNGATAQATPAWPGAAQWNGSISPQGDRDYYAFTLPSAKSVTLTTHTLGDPSTCPGDTMIRVLDAAGGMLAAADDGGPGKCSLLTKSLPAGSYFVWVQATNDASAIPKYELDLSAL